MLINLQTKKIPVPFMGGKILARPTLTEVLYILGCREELSEMTVIDFSVVAVCYPSGVLKQDSSMLCGMTLTTIKDASVTT